MKLISLINPEITIAELATLCDKGDTLLLRQDAVYLARRSDIRWPCQNVTVLKSDLEVRKITPTTGISIIDDAQWVELTASATQVMLWQ
ncbi:DsrH/TusB family sulfur metabolism protein [Arsukibacterium sp.]|uniref:DsrH/TusB family sulfur metabolism protein n=1 Tax=Arsukibacterium sp. TaxID=1977258 RepID=UPI0035665B94